MRYGLLKYLVVPVLLVVGGAAGPSTANAQSARIKIDSLEKLSDKASETVDVTLDQKLIQIAAKFLSSSRSSDEAKIKEIVEKIQGVYVKSYEFDKEGQYSKDDLDSILSQVKTPFWSRIVGVTSKKSGENVEVYINTDGNDIGGLAVVAWEPKELTVVNIVGPIDVQKLSELEGNFGIPKLHLHLDDANGKDKDKDKNRDKDKDDDSKKE